MSKTLSEQEIEHARKELLKLRPDQWQSRNPNSLLAMDRQDGTFAINALCDLALSAKRNEADAERYRWLRQNMTYQASGAESTPDGLSYKYRRWYYDSKQCEAVTLDAAIDAAKGSQ